MSFVSGTTGNEAAQKFLEVLQGDFKNLAQETKKKYPQIKEVSSSNYCYFRIIEFMIILWGPIKLIYKKIKQNHKTLLIIY